MRYAVFHDGTLELLGTLAAREYPEQAFGPIRDGRTFYLPMTEPVPARVADYEAESAVVFTRVEFRPLILKNAHNHTFALFVDSHPDDLRRVRGFKPI